MYRKVLNYLRGQVTVEVESAAPERVLNLCAAHGIPFWELEWLSEIRLRAVTSSRRRSSIGWSRLRCAASRG